MNNSLHHLRKIVLGMLMTLRIGVWRAGHRRRGRPSSEPTTGDLQTITEESDLFTMNRCGNLR